jgi:hypothetical protein
MNERQSQASEALFACLNGFRIQSKLAKSSLVEIARQIMQDIIVQTLKAGVQAIENVKDVSQISQLCVPHVVAQWLS